MSVLKNFSLSSRVSVSRAIKPFSEPGRPPDWFSQKVRNLQSNITFSFCLFRRKSCYGLLKDCIINTFSFLVLSTVPHNTLSCWRPQKHLSQFHNTDIEMHSCVYQRKIFNELTESAYILLFSRRKRGEKGEVVETIEDVIVRRLTTERIEELKKLLRDTQEQYRYIHILKTTSKIFGIFRHSL